MQRSLRHTFIQVNGNVTEFEREISVKEVSKLLIKYHENYEAFEMDNNYRMYYPCKPCDGESSEQCQYFSVRNRTYGRELYCEPCNVLKNKRQRNVRRLVNSPTRRQPVDSMSPDRKILAFIQVIHDKQMIDQKHSRFLVMLEVKQEKCVFEHKSKPN